MPAVWKSWLGEQFPAFSRGLLRKRPERARSYPCARGCGCAHEIIERRDGSLVAVCRCEPWNCEDFAVAASQVALLELNWPQLGRRLCAALKCDVREADLGLQRARQIGAFSAAAVPVVLVIQESREDFGNSVAALAARIGRPFALLSPTSRFLVAGDVSILKGVGAASFDLESNILLLANGTLQAQKTAGELFSALMPQAAQPEPEDVARRLFALIEELEAEGKWRKAPVTKVFQLYCVKRLSRSEVAKRCGCVPALITLRLKLIEKKLGRKPVELRALSSHFEKIKESLSDPRARRIDPKRAIYGEDADDAQVD